MKYQKLLLLCTMCAITINVSSTGIIKRAVKFLGLSPKEGFNSASTNTGVSKSAIQDYAKNFSVKNYTGYEFNSEFDNNVINISNNTGLPQEYIKKYLANNMNDGESINSIFEKGVDYKNLILDGVSNGNIDEIQAGDVLQNLIDKGEITADQANSISDDLNLGRVYLSETESSDFEVIHLEEYPEGGEIFKPVSTTDSGTEIYQTVTKTTYNPNPPETVQKIDSPSMSKGTVKTQKGPEKAIEKNSNSENQPQKISDIPNQESHSAKTTKYNGNQEEGLNLNTGTTNTSVDSNNIKLQQSSIGSSINGKTESTLESVSKNSSNTVSSLDSDENRSSSETDSNNENQEEDSGDGDNIVD